MVLELVAISPRPLTVVDDLIVPRLLKLLSLKFHDCEAASAVSVGNAVMQTNKNASTAAKHFFAFLSMIKNLPYTIFNK